MSKKTHACKCAHPSHPVALAAPTGPKPVQEMSGGEINLEVLRCIEDVGAAEIDIAVHEAIIANTRTRILEIRQRENQLHNERRRREIAAEQR